TNNLDLPFFRTQGRLELGTLILIEIDFYLNWETATNLGWASLTGFKLKTKIQNIKSTQVVRWVDDPMRDVSHHY
ncbi:hypothetical protein GIB67_012734, partial [Kingdonia uniflora]